MKTIITLEFDSPEAAAAYLSGNAAAPSAPSGKGSTGSAADASTGSAAATTGGKASGGKGAAGKPAAKTEPTTEDRSGGIAYETISAKVLEVSKTKGRDAAKNLLAEFQTAAGENCTKGAEIEPEDYGAFIEKADEVLNEEDLG